MKKILFFLSFLLCLNFHSVHALEVVNLSCEMSEAPLTVTETFPRFGWQIVSEENGTYQTAYAIELYEWKNGNETLLWETGKIPSHESQFIVYEGNKKLRPLTKYCWRVRIWNEKGAPSPWSKKAFFRVAPTKDWLNAKWIGTISKEEANLPQGRNFHATELKKPEIKALWNNVNPISKKSIYLRQVFESGKEVRDAMAYVCGLGLYEFSLNGQKIGDSEFSPLNSDYDKTVYYNAYDLSDEIKRGPNVIGILLGNGFYNVQGGRYTKLLVSFGPPTLFFKMIITYTDGTTHEIISDENWKYSFSPITFNCIYGGEDYDATREQPRWNQPGFNDSAWKPVVVQHPPKGALRPQQTTPIKIMERYGVKKIHKLNEGKYVLDMGQNLAGFPEITVNGQRGDTVRLIVGESLNEDGSVNQKQTGSKHYYTYILKGDTDENWHPRFSYYGFRYIQVEGATFEKYQSSFLPRIKEINSCFVYNSAKAVASFNCSNPIFNNTHRIIDKAVKSNMQGVFTDCPHREKLGWLEQVHLNGPGLFYNYDLRTFIPKIMQDISDAQLPNGLIPNIAPEYVEFEGAFRDSPEWGSAGILVPWMYYLYYGDPSLIKRHYHMMKKYVDYLSSKADHHIISHGLGDWYDYTGERAGFSKNTPVPLVATAHYYGDIVLLSKAAQMMENQKDEKYYAQLSEKIKNAYNATFFDEQTNQYGTGSQCSNAISLYFGLVDPQNKSAVLDNLVKNIRKHGNRLTTGDVGTRYLFQTLANSGLNELVYTMNNHEEVPGYGFQLKFGATTLTEQWDPRQGASWNHFMMGHIDEWFFAWLAGIQPNQTSPGFKKFIINPQVVGDLTSVTASTETLYGRVAVNWEIENGIFKLEVAIPVNTEAEIILPDKSFHTVGSGKYSFRVKM